jgi:CRP/FNR family transcriptional regulator
LREKGRGEALLLTAASDVCGKALVRGGAMALGQQIITGCAQKQEALAELTRGARAHSYGRGELLNDIGERDGFVYLLQAGWVGLYSLSGQGREILVSTFDEGDMVGLIRHDEVSDTCSYAKVLVDATLAYRLSYPHVLELMSTSLPVSSYVCTLLCRQLGEAYRIIEDLAFYEIKTRLARTLVRLALSSEELIVSATHAELAAMIGTRQEEVTKLLGHFRALGLVASAPHRRGLRLLDLERLSSM